MNKKRYTRQNQLKGVVKVHNRIDLVKSEKDGWSESFGHQSFNAKTSEQGLLRTISTPTTPRPP